MSKILGWMAAAVTLAFAALAMFAGSLAAQAEAPADPKVYEACERGKQEIRAGALPRVVEEDRCPVAGRTIVDNGVGAVVPRPGESVYASASTTGGGQELIVSNPRGGEVLVQGVGDETEGATAKGATAEGATAEPQPALSRFASRSSNACGDGYYRNWDWKVYNYNRWYINGGSIPSYMSKAGAVGAIKRGGQNVQGVQDPCGVGDGVRGELRYQGSTRRGVDINASGVCGSNDGTSVVGFGNLPRSYTGKACVYSWIQNGPNRVSSSDIRLNKTDHLWTTRVTGSCRNRQDLESTVTHERGHTFGLGDASPSSHPYLTMNSATGGTCRTFKRTLGKGDAIGVNRKYR